MKIKMLNLLEDNKSIEDLIGYIDSKIISLRKNKTLKETSLIQLHTLYQNIIGDWMKENYLMGIESNIKEEKEITDNLLEFISYLNKL